MRNINALKGLLAGALLSLSSNAHAQVVLGDVEVYGIGHQFQPEDLFGNPPTVREYLIDQGQNFGGGATLQPVSANLDTNSQFTLTVSAPPGYKFVVQVPPGKTARFAGSILMESTYGGTSPVGPVTASFTGLEGTSPGFTESDAVLSRTHGYFGFVEILSDSFTGNLAFTSLTLSGTVTPQVTGQGTKFFNARTDNRLTLLYQAAQGSSDPGPFVSLVSDTSTNAPVPPTNPPCLYTVSPKSIYHGYQGASNAVTVTTASNCSWNVINTNSWISIAVTNGTGSATVTYLVSANPSGAQRRGYFSIANWLVYILQAGSPGGDPCFVTLSPWVRSHSPGLSTNLVTVSTGAGCPWNVSTTNSWITIDSATNGSGSGIVDYRVGVNPSPAPRTGYIAIGGGQPFTVYQEASLTPISSTPVVIPTIEVTNIGHVFYDSNPLPGFPSGPSRFVVQNFLIDQDHWSGAGAILPNVSVNWDTNSQFTVTVAAPAGKRFLVDVPAGRSVGFGGFLWWESTRGGSSPAGTVSVQFENLEGAAPQFSETTPVLSSTHGFFGFVDLEGTTVSNWFAFTAVTLTGTLAPQYTGNGTEGYLPHNESSMLLHYTTSGTNDPGPFVSIVPTGPLPFIRMIGIPTESGVELEVRGRPGRTYVVECSLDTVTWTQIATGVMPTSGSTQVRDAAKTLPTGSRFYRTVELPNVPPTPTQ